MAKNIPVRAYRKNYIVNSVADLVTSFRLTNNLTQKKLAIEIGAYCSSSGNTVISEYENGKTLPGIEYIYRISNVLGIDKDSFFNIVLKEHFKRFTEKHMSIYTNFIQHNNFDKCISYYFCTKGVVKYSFTKLSAILKESIIKHTDVRCVQF
jgi:transcriptional regulator with XRE-family HTH domain